MPPPVAAAAEETPPVSPAMSQVLSPPISPKLPPKKKPGPSKKRVSCYSMEYKVSYKRSGGIGTQESRGGGLVGW